SAHKFRYCSKTSSILPFDVFEVNLRTRFLEVLERGGIGGKRLRLLPKLGLVEESLWRLRRTCGPRSGMSWPIRHYQPAGGCIASSPSSSCRRRLLVTQALARFQREAQGASAPPVDS